MMGPAAGLNRLNASICVLLVGLLLRVGVTATQESTAQEPLDVPMFGANPAHTGEQPGPGNEADPVARWRFEMPGDVNEGPAVVDGVVYAGNRSFGTPALYALDALDAATGQERWRFAVGGIVVGAPVIVAGVIYVIGGTVIPGTLYALGGDGS